MAGIGSGISAEITATSPTQTYPIPVTVTFKKNGANHSVSNFANDFTTSFKPSEINGLELWLDASDGSSILHSSNDVSAWNDKSGNGLQALIFKIQIIRIIHNLSFMILPTSQCLIF